MSNRPVRWRAASRRAWTDPVVLYLDRVRPVVALVLGLALLAISPLVDVPNIETVGAITAVAGFALGMASRTAARMFGHVRVLPWALLVDIPLIGLITSYFEGEVGLGIAFLWPVALAAMLATPIQTMAIAVASVSTGFVVAATSTTPRVELYAINSVGIFGLAVVIALLRLNEHRANIERRAIEQQLHAAQAIAKIGSFEFDPATGDVEWSPELFRIFAITDGTPLGHAAFVEAVEERDRELVAGTLARSLATGESVALDAHMVRTDGEPFIARVTGSTHGFGGERPRIVGTVQDVTELRRIDDLRDEFVAAASHELRTPASIVLGFSSTLDQRWELLSDDERRRFVGEIDDAARRLALLVEDVLQVTQIESGAARCARDPFDLVAELRAIIDSWPGTVPVELRGVGQAWVVGDVIRTRQVVTNLLANVDRHAAGATTTEVVVGVDGDRVVVEVVDDGPGISDADRERIFERFVRLDRTVVGTGLGLYLSRRLAEAQGGSLAAGSRSDGRAGACFTLVMPADAGRVGE